MQKQDDRRISARHSLQKPVPATYGGFSARLVELSLVGCQIEHTDRVTPKSRLPLRFKWRGEIVRVDATITRSEMRAIGGKPAYVSGLEFCKSPDDSPHVVREIVGWLVKQMPAVAEEPEVLAAKYLQCTYGGGEWEKLYVDDPRQPGDGFTIAAPSNDAEVDVLCRAYANAGADKRRAMRASFENAIAKKT